MPTCSAVRRSADVTRASVGIRLATVGISVLAAMNCGQTSSDQPASDVDLCSLVTRPELAQALGVKPGAPVRADLSVNWLACNWPAPDGSIPNMVYVTYQPRNNTRTYDEWAEAIKSSLGEDTPPDILDTFTRVDGLGDFAVFSDNGWLGGGLQVFKNGGMLQVGTSITQISDLKPPLKALARKAMERLP